MGVMSPTMLVKPMMSEKKIETWMGVEGLMGFPMREVGTLVVAEGLRG